MWWGGGCDWVAVQWRNVILREEGSTVVVVAMVAVCCFVSTKHQNNLFFAVWSQRPEAYRTYLLSCRLVSKARSVSHVFCTYGREKREISRNLPRKTFRGSVHWS